ncbi:MAG: dihydrofolate reductase [Candidatus Edwardsbacteria bacterium]|nr:dihydrofolate reductase [Candidatus Edwardsbacteria bacterium]
MPKRIIIVAMTRGRVIGRGGRMPWHLSDDLKLFKAATFGNTVVMGRKTFESIGRPLPNRNNIVISGTMAPVPGVTVCPTFEDALRAADGIGRDVFFIGGAAVYQRALALAEELRVSWVDGDHEGDTLFPEFDPDRWEKVSERPFPGFTHASYRRK